METVLSEAQDVGEVIAWRREQLMATGFPFPLAVHVARDLHYDLHALIELVESGCAPELAIRILAPIDGESAA
jgi:hypothetical protein